MSFNEIKFGTLRSERVPSLHNSKDEIHSGSLANDLGHHSSSGPSASPSITNAAQTFIFSIDGNGLLTRRAATPHGKQASSSDAPHCCSTRTSDDSGRNNLMSDRDSVAGVIRNGERLPTPLVRALSSVPPSTAAAASFPFIMRGVSCAARRPNTAATAAAAAGAARFENVGESASSSFDNHPYTTSSSESCAKTRFNNYVIGQSVPTGFRSSSAASREGSTRQRPPRVPVVATISHSVAASQGTSPPLNGASSSVHAVSAHSTGKNGVHTCTEEGKASARQPKTHADVAEPTAEANKPSPASPDSTSPVRSASVASAPVRPSLQHQPLHPNSNTSSVLDSTTVYAQGAVSHASETGSSSSVNSAALGDHTRASSKESTDTSKRPHAPFLRMTRTSALRRPVLLTKDTSAAAVASTSGSAKSIPRASTSNAALEGRSRSSFTNRRADLPERRAPSSSSTSTVARFPAYAPVPPRAASSQPQRLRRASLGSMTSAWSSTFYQHRQSVDDDPAPVRLFFQSMPSFTAAQNDKAEDNKSSSDNSASAFNAAASRVSVRGGATADSEVEGSSALGGRVDSVSTSSIQRRNGSEPPHPQRRSFRSLPSASNSAPSVMERLRERGKQYMMREEFAQAITAYSEAIRLAPSCDILGNRAAAFLLTFQYLPAVVDCLYMLSFNPGSVKAHWRAAKAYAAAYRFLDAKKYYLLAQQACMKEHDGLTSITADDLRLDVGSGNDAQNHIKQDKEAKDRSSIAAEAAAVEMVEEYWQHMRAERWSEAVAVMDKILATASYAGPTAVSWQALRLEALLPIHPKTAAAEAESLHSTFPSALELYYVLAKALFYTVHDAASTKRSLQLLDEATAKRSKQNTTLNLHVRHAAMQLRECRMDEGGDTAAVQLESWARRNQLREDSRIAELRHTIEKFARRRDSGNSAYEKGNWDAAAAAYTQCLQTDRLNHALLAAVYCNRTAVYMQAGRWREALSDANAAIQLNPQLVTAYSRRGRIQMYLLSQEYEAQRAVLSRRFSTPWSAAVKEQLMQYADAAVADLTRAVELSPTADLKNQLWQALSQRQTVNTAFSAAQPGNTAKASASSSSSSRTFPHTGSGKGSAYQRSYGESQSASTDLLYGVLQSHLQLLGVDCSGPTAGLLPDFKVIAKAYREAALRWHPDKWVTSTPQEQQEAERQFKLISIAYTSLRERYSDGSMTS
ncbi:hypothetical protein ABL78_1657 [Leptomonas seymouri]|uniref:J domain-containing protein n=1 Tax=Leptomonas seymouri TaxID=5684 RepID=A0A0N1I741_LEPSE|nr:hypothetical protein ABL78_1657 [Leptomonas seymouri]|eukprot:KPI89234.1 hypothetical protein ABL78_1657 [Leptomonas seymouri]